MKLDDIRALAQIARDNGLSMLEVSDDGKTVRMERAAPAAEAVSGRPLSPSVPAAEAVPVPAAPPGTVITASLVGVFYAAPSPDSPPFVKTGSKVKAGDVLCIIEAMKLMNEITAEADGVIAEVLAENGQVVEYGQGLFRMV